ncbi:hypothetical protein HNY73_010581 [Argiope bruennichi]|uniref:Neurensin-1 n=1 Tax=Argiope bruennichi TaxID=94029 RepID=A0A8T0F3Y5_ARGBR|nr:hypothetical protein HNY73_010581 [Argiope bruennichi]
MNRVRNNQEDSNINVPITKEEKQKILQKSLYKKDITDRMKMKLDSAKLLGEKNLKNEILSDKSNNNDSAVIPMNGMDEFNNEEARPKFFGVRNYLHTFYETINLRNPQMYEDIPDESDTNNDDKKFNPNCKFYWKVGIYLALVIVIVGLILILIGFVTPLHTSGKNKQEEFLVIDKSSTTLNDYMGICRLIGIGMFIVGFSLFLAVVLLAVCFHSNEGNNDSEDEESENVCLSFNMENSYQKEPDESIPVTEESEAVQVIKDTDEAVVTSNGLRAPQNVPPK